MKLNTQEFTPVSSVCQFKFKTSEKIAGNRGKSGRKKVNKRKKDRHKAGPLGLLTAAWLSRRCAALSHIDAGFRVKFISDAQ